MLWVRTARPRWVIKLPSLPRWRLSTMRHRLSGETDPERMVKRCCSSGHARRWPLLLVAHFAAYYGLTKGLLGP